MAYKLTASCFSLWSSILNTSTSSSSSCRMKTVVILGGSYAGLSSAHRILKQATKKGLSLKVVIVSPNSQFYWNIASPRALLEGQFDDEQIFKPIESGFKQYPKSQFELVLGFAKRLDVAARKVEITTGSSGRTTSLDYDFLILATGSRAKDAGDGMQIPFKNLNSTEETLDALHKYQKVVKQSKTIVIAGGGPTGVETAGEIAFEYGSTKKVILVTSGQTVLEGSMAGVSKSALNILRDLKVDVRLQTKVSSARQTTSDGHHEVILSDGSQLSADLYIPTYGIVPNSSYIPSEYLNEDGFVMVDDYLKIKNLHDQPIWAIGDVTDREAPQVLYVDRQATHVAKSIFLTLENKDPIAYKNGIVAMGLQIGRKTGTGHAGKVRLPGFFIHMMRKDLSVGRATSFADGSAF